MASTKNQEEQREQREQLLDAIVAVLNTRQVSPNVAISAAASAYVSLCVSVLMAADSEPLREYLREVAAVTIQLAECSPADLEKFLRLHGATMGVM